MINSEDIDILIARIEAADTDSFVELAKLAGLNPLVHFRYSNLEGVDFSGLDLTGFDFTGAKMSGCIFAGAKIRGARFEEAQVDNRDLRKASDWHEFVAERRPSYRYAFEMRQPTNPTTSNKTSNEFSDRGAANISLRSKWEHIQRTLRLELGEDVYTSWFGRVELEGYKQGHALLSVPTRFLKNWLESHYRDKLADIVRGEFEDVRSVDFEVRMPRGNEEKAAVAARAERIHHNGTVGYSDRIVSDLGRSARNGVRTEYEGFEGSPLDRHFTFERFVVGSSNRLAHAATWQIAETLGESPLRYNPLFIHSNVGLGKTHLLHAIAWEVRRRNAQTRVLYLTAERFMYSFVEALRARDALAFKDNLRRIDILLIDDMEFLQGRTIQQEFGQALNSLIDRGKQVVVASDRAPTLLKSLDARMRSRLAGGLVTEIGALDYDLRLKVLRKRAAEKAANDPEFIIDDTVFEFLATRLTESCRELEGAIIRIYAAYQLTPEPITVETAKHIVRDLMRGEEPKRVNIDDILRIISKHYGVSRGDILSQSRKRSIVWPRQIGMYLANNMTSHPMSEIGRRFGGRSQTTVRNAIRKIEEQTKENPRLQAEIQILEQVLTY